MIMKCEKLLELAKELASCLGLCDELTYDMLAEKARKLLSEANKQ